MNVKDVQDAEEGESELKISHYSFGSITIDDKAYTSDVIIYPGRVDSKWWRKEGHYLQPADLTDIIDAKPDILIIGTGNSGVMQVPKETLQFIKTRGIEVHVGMTDSAVELFSKMQSENSDKIIIAALHLTC